MVVSCCVAVEDSGCLSRLTGFGFCKKCLTEMWRSNAYEYSSVNWNFKKPHPQSWAQKEIVKPDPTILWEKQMKKGMITLRFCWKNVESGSCTCSVASYMFWKIDFHSLLSGLVHYQYHFVRSASLKSQSRTPKLPSTFGVQTRSQLTKWNFLFSCDKPYPLW